MLFGIASGLRDMSNGHILRGVDKQVSLFGESSWYQGLPLGMFSNDHDTVWIVQTQTSSCTCALPLASDLSKSPSPVDFTQS